jgi:hypothetical protein
MNIDRSFGIKALSTEQLKGGAAASYKRKTEKNEEIRKSYEMTPAAAEKYDAEQAEKFALRKTQYESDLDEAKENTSGSNNEELKAWEKQYQDDKEKAKKVAERAGGKFSEDKFRSDYETGSYLSGGQKITAPPKPKVKEFNEKEFKKAYEKGGDLSSVGLGKEVEAGSLEKARTFKDVNEDRRQAQAWHIDHPTSTMGKDGEEIKTGLRDLGRLFVEGMKETATSKGGIATAALTGIPTFGVGAAATIVGGGVLHALKTVIRAKALDENSWVPKKLGFAPDPNLAASVRKQTSASQKIVDILKDVEGGNKNIGKELKNVVSPSPTPPPTGNTHTPTH